MEQRRWEDLDKDCLVNVFQKVEMESLLMEVPFVCKSWYEVTLNPLCWKRLVFKDCAPEWPYGPEYPTYDRFVSEFRIDKSHFSKTAFIKSVVNRSQGNATLLRLPECCTNEAFENIATACPKLVFLGLSSWFLLDSDINLELIGTLKNLGILSLGNCSHLNKILGVVSENCKYFSGLRLSNANICKDGAMAIVNLVPHIKLLSLNSASISRDALIILLKGCKDLVNLEAKGCIGFDEGDEEILKLASHIANFCFEGSIENFGFDFFSAEHMVEIEGHVEELALMIAEIGE